MQKNQLKCRLAIFDLDGTILNTLEDLASSVNHALSVNRYPLRTVDEIRSFLGNGIRLLIRKSMSGAEQTAEEDTVLNDFVEFYRIHSADHTRPYAGIPELFRDLHGNGIKVAVVSNKADFAVQNLCRKFFPNMLDFAVGERAGIRKKPAPDTVFEALEKTGIAGKDAVFIGDSEVDVETAKNAGINGIFVSWGFRSVEQLREAGAGEIVNSPDQLNKMLTGCVGK